MLALYGKAVEQAGTEPVEPFQQVEYRHAGDEGASPFLAGGSDAASLPTALDEEPMEVTGPLEREETHLRARNVKRPANRRH